MDNAQDNICSAKEEEPGGASVCADYAPEPVRYNDVPLTEKASWQNLYKHSVSNIDDIAGYLSLNPREKALLRQVTRTYHMRIPDYYLSLIQDPSNPHDPIRQQCVPSPEELYVEANEDMDPLGEEQTSPTPCLIHRYPDRALLIVTSRCFMYCRHCTRKRLWKTNFAMTSLKEIQLALRYIQDNKQIREVIVSGGDPLTLPTERIDRILYSIASIRQIEVIRIGTRTPVVMPRRIDDDLCRVLEKYNNLWINVQFNHPMEITPESTLACRKLQRCGIPVSNQSVLLRGINDDPGVMTELCHKLQAIRVRPYYLFQCDRVVGTSHFRTPVSKGIEIMEKMRGHTGGMCIPSFVVDGEGGKGKIPLLPNYLVELSEDGALLRDFQNKTFFYHNPGKLCADDTENNKNHRYNI